MTDLSGSFRFDRFVLDPADRRLRDDQGPVELNGRYLDALVLLVAEAGRLVSKDRFLEEVWRGVPVTDEALTQCIRALRRQLGDDAARPRFIETVPKHGYRFIAPVEPAGGSARAAASATRSDRWPRLLVLGGAGTAGGGLAGAIGGLIYGFAAASQPLDASVGALSVLLVVVSACVAVAVLGGAGVAFGIAGAGLAAGRPAPWIVLGGSAGGLLVGAGVKLVGLDAFALLVGRSPGDITGAGEGAALGAAVGLGAWLAARRAFSPRRAAAVAGLIGAAVGVLIALLGGRLMAGSLEMLASRFPGSRWQLPIGPVVGETGFGPLSRAVTSALEGALFAAFVVGAMALAWRTVESRRSGPCKPEA